MNLEQAVASGSKRYIFAMIREQVPQAGEELLPGEKKVPEISSRVLGDVVKLVK